MPLRPQPPLLRVAAMAWLALSADGAAGAATIQVACVGDSITFGAGASDPATRSYPAVLAGLLGSGYAVGNFGHSGATMLHNGDLPYVSVGEYPASDAYAPDVVVIMLGTNDSKPQNWQYQAQFVSDTAALIAHYQALPSHPLVFMCTDCPVYGSGNYGITEPVVHDEVIPLIRSTAAAASVPVIDIYAAMSGIPLDFPDNVHPDDGGYVLLAQAVYRAIHLPAAATALNASAVSASRVDLAWSDASDNESGFRIERKTGAGGAYATLASVAADTVAYSDASVAPTSTYFYRVVALNAAGAALASNEASASTPAAPAGAAPTASSSGSRHCGHGAQFGAGLLLVLIGLVRRRTWAGRRGDRQPSPSAP